MPAGLCFSTFYGVVGVSVNLPWPGCARVCWVCVCWLQFKLIGFGQSAATGGFRRLFAVQCASESGSGSGANVSLMAASAFLMTPEDIRQA